MVAKPLYPLYKNIIKPLDRVRYPELRYFSHFFSFYANLNLNELSTTLTLEKAIRALAHIGVIWKSMPKI